MKYNVMHFIHRFAKHGDVIENKPNYFLKSMIEILESEMMDKIYWTKPDYH